jgi:hypothetical protein
MSSGKGPAFSSPLWSAIGTAVIAAAAAVYLKDSKGPLWVYAAVAALGSGLLVPLVLVRVGRAVRARIPRRPWLATPWTQSGRWIEQRPSVTIMFPQPYIRQSPEGLIDAWEISLTLYEASPAKLPFSIDYRNARLKVRPRKGQAGAIILTPVETCGFLDLERSQAQSVVVRFRWAKTPCWTEQAPDLGRGAVVILSGVVGRLHSKRCIHGRLPPVESQLIDPTEPFEPIVASSAFR